MLTCEFIASARPIDRAIAAEQFHNTMHRVSRCPDCEKFHIWAQVTQLEWAGAANARERITADYYNQVGPNSYLHKGFAYSKKKKKANKDDNDDED